MRRLLCSAAVAALVSAAALAQTKDFYSTVETSYSTVIKTPAGKPVLRSVTGPLPEGEKKPAVDSAGYFHPIWTPAGEVLTDSGPKDHPHHRGVFVGWIQVVGEQSGDFWGWGAKAPVKNRRIVNVAMLKKRQIIDEKATGISGTSREDATLNDHFEWLAEDLALLGEEQTARVSERPGCFVIDLEYKFIAKKEVRIEANPFGGFAYRGRAEGKLETTGPDGPVALPDAKHDKNDANWPVASWYDFTYRLEKDKVCGLALMDHPKNPRAPWYVNRGIRTLNPCIVAEKPLTIKAGQPLVLRYRLVAHDGDAKSVPLAEIYKEFSQR